jgi:hypothetical protein
MSPNELTEEEEEALDIAGLDDLEPIPEVASPPKKSGLRPVEDENEGDAEPDMASPEWSEFALSHFTRAEKDQEGNPRVAGLRRVTRLLLGPILVSRAKVVQSPGFGTGANGATTPVVPAVVEHTIRLLMCRVPGGEAAYEVEYTEAADVYFGNTDPMFAVHATATASTKAEARALRKLLGLTGVIAAEEVTRVPLEEASVKGFITPTQINFLRILCQRNDINLDRYINGGKIKFESVERVPFNLAQKMVQYLSECQNDNNKIRPEWKGWQE